MAQQHKRKMKVGIIEDSVLIQDRLKTMLEQVPCAEIVAVVNDLKSAEQLLLQLESTLVAAKKIQAVILDTQLPDGNGLDFLKKLKRVAPEIKVVVFSNHSSDECRLLAKRAGADKFLDKSTDSELLVPLLQLWQQQNFESTYRK